MWYESAFLYGLTLCLLALIGLGAQVAPAKVGLSAEIEMVLFKMIKSLFKPPLL